MGDSVVGRRVAYYATVVVGAVLVHQQIFADVAGDAVADFLRRNSEAYALMVLVPLFWDLFGWSSSPNAARPTERRGRGWWHQPGLGAWTGTLAAAVFITQSDLAGELGLPASVITLGEAFLAAAVVSVYMAWSRAIGVVPGRASGAPVESWRVRAWYYAAAIILLIVAASQMAAIDGAGLGEWVARNAEAFTAMVLLPLYFDAIAAPQPSRGKRLAWYGAMIALPLLVASGATDNLLPQGLAELISRSTEAFIAALAVAFYFDVWRGRVTHPRARSGGEVADGFPEQTVEPADP